MVQGVLTELGTVARLAEPGEFTQRALLHNKLNILQVEALADLLSADTSQQRKQALSQLEGEKEAIFGRFREQLIAGLAHAEAVIDFGDDELDENDDQPQDSVWGDVQHKMRALRHSMERELSSRGAERVREGVKIAIIGPPNAGKSSLFNLLADRDAAIVSSKAGTTRDVLEVTLDLGGAKCILQDTAGMREETEDSIEREGMARAVAAAEKADLVVAMVDASIPSVTDNISKDLISNQKSGVLLVCNKVDLVSDPSSRIELIGGHYGLHPHAVSCVTENGLEDFLGALTKKVEASLDTHDGLITRARHRQHMKACVEALSRFDTLSQQGHMSIDLAAEELRLASSELGRITGAVDVEDVLDKLFADFCIGK